MANRAPVAAKHRRRPFWKKHHFSLKTRKPISTTGKIICLGSLFSVVMFGAAIIISAGGGDNIERVEKIFGGIGFLCMYIGIVFLALAVLSFKNEAEPFWAKILMLVMSVCGTIPWIAVFVLGMWSSS